MEGSLPTEEGMIREVLSEDPEPVIKGTLGHRIEVVWLQEELGRRLLQEHPAGTLRCTPAA
jgi:hypothetical protein